MEMGITCPEKLPFMPDSFWKQWLELAKCGDFKLTDNEVFDEGDMEKYPEFFKEGEDNNLFRLMRNVIAFPILHEHPIDLGQMSITWPYSKFDITEITANSQLAFRKLYELNKILMDRVMPEGTKVGVL